MAQKNINLGSADYAGDGENIRSAFAKIQDNFTELFDRPTTEAGNTLQIDLQGNVVGADSALIINSSDSSITAGGGITGDLTGDVTGDVTGTVSGISNHDLSSLGNVSTAVPTTGQVLKWNGSEWAPGTDNTGSGGSDGSSFSFIVAADDSVQRIINNQETLSVLGGTNLNTSANPEAAVTINLDTSISLDSVTTTSLFTSTIDTTDSSSLTITPSVVMSSDLTVENTLNLTNAVNLPAGSTLNGQSLSVTDGITEVVQDTSPQLGGNLDLNNFDITGTGNIPAANLSGALPAIDGSSLTGITVSALDGDVTGSVFADDSTLLVDGVNGTVNISNQSIDDLSDVDTTTIAPSRDTQPLVWDTVDGNWYPGNGISISAIARIETGGMLYFDASSSMVFEGTTANNFETTITASDPSQDNAIVIPDASGTLALTSTTLAGYGITDAYTKAEVDSSIADVTAGHFDFNITGDDSTVRTVSSGSTIGIVGGTGITTASDVDGNITITASGGGGSGLQSRGTVTGTTSSLADAAEADLDITGFKSYALLTITTDRAARVRLYVSAATRTADASRAEGVDPTSDAGLIAEVITTGADTVIISPGAYGFNLESSPTTTIPCRVTNKSGGASTVQVDLNILQLEA